MKEVETAMTATEQHTQKSAAYLAALRVENTEIARLVLDISELVRNLALEVEQLKREQPPEEWFGGSR